MHILQTPVRFYPYTGGVESYVHDLSKVLVKLDHDVTVLSAKTNANSPTEAMVNGIKVQRLSSVGKVAQTNITPYLPIALYQFTREADIIHTHIPTPWSADLSAIAALLSNTPLILTYHNDIVGDGLMDTVASVYNSTALKFTLNVADRILVTQPDYIDSSNYLQSFEQKVEIVSNGVDVDRFYPLDLDSDDKRSLGFATDRPNLFFLSVLDRYHEYKGLDVLLRALRNIEDLIEPVPRLVVGGAGELKEKYESLAIDIGISDHVEFVGYIPEKDIVSAYNAADLFILPSTSSDQEGFGLVVLEALSCGTPVVTTDVVGVSEEIDENCIGSVVQPNDIESLSDAIVEWLSKKIDDFDYTMARSLCVEQYSWRSSGEDLIEIYNEVTRS